VLDMPCRNRRCLRIPPLDTANRDAFMMELDGFGLTDLRLPPRSLTP
jgi:hypothetical protein